MGHFSSGGMNELVRQAARMQRKIDQVKKEFGDKEVSESFESGKVIATATYAGKVSRVQVDPAFLESEGLEVTLDAVCVAANAALETAKKGMDAELAKVTGGAKVPGL
ncbi:MAG: YbaB/EbfC family nucleoid-associated protein [Polyangiaceae bacterium]|nr:YbaB/EbfC family nucleoid-associated protein [Polyangiaceae bacterium]